MGGKDQLCSTDKPTESERCGLFCELTFQTRADRMVTPLTRTGRICRIWHHP